MASTYVVKLSSR